MPRPQKYDWEDKRDICYKLWTEDKLTGPQIVEYFAKHFNVPTSELPRSNQFGARFRLWGFPARRPKWTPEEEAKLVARTKEMFNQNLPAQKIQEQLIEEDWDMDDYHFRALRKKHGMIMRNLVGYKPLPNNKKRKRSDLEPANELDDAGEEDEDEASVPADEQPRLEQAPVPQLSSEEQARRAQRQTELEAQSDHLLATGKRRRRIRGYGHLPPDAPMDPRYGSETSLDECKAYLHFSNEVYTQVRTQFEAICREMSILKMSTCAEGQWQAAKDRLVLENMHLAAVLHPLQADLDKKVNALNCICMDVTKRMRNMSKAMTIADANNILGLDPLASKELRRILYDILEADHFTTVVACGKEHLEGLRQQWYAQSEDLQRILAEANPEKTRALMLLDKDARKRFCDDQVRKDPSRRQWQRQKHYGPGPGPAHGVVRIQRGPITSATSDQPDNPSAPNTTTKKTAPKKKDTEISRTIPLAPGWAGQDTSSLRITTVADAAGHDVNLDIDPELGSLGFPSYGPAWPPTNIGNNVDYGHITPEMLAAERDRIATLAAAQNHTSNATAVTQNRTTVSTATAVSPLSALTSIPAYFRLAPNSTLVGHHPRMWLGKLASPTIGALHTAATVKVGAARLAKIQGVVKNVDGSEDSWLIESDDELAVYLEEAGEKATFVVVLEAGYA